MKAPGPPEEAPGQGACVGRQGPEAAFHTAPPTLGVLRVGEDTIHHVEEVGEGHSSTEPRDPSIHRARLRVRQRNRAMHRTHSAPAPDYG